MCSDNWSQPKIKKMDRRKFINLAGCGAMGSTTLFNTLINLKTMNAASIANSSVFAGGDYKALVCFFLRGGNDSYNMLIPKANNEEYNDYAAARTDLAIAQDDILPLSGTDYGVHPAMSNIQTLFDDGKLSFVANTGSLIEPVTMETMDNGSASLPLGLYSHSDQVQQWQTSIPHERSSLGWGGKVADLLGDTNGNENISMNISLAGSNIFQTGVDTTSFALKPWSENGAILLSGYNGGSTFNQLKTAAIDNLVEASYENMFEQAFMNTNQVSINANLEFLEAIENITLMTTFSDNDVSERLKLVARSIAIREELNMTRQIYFVDLGGWDMHDELTNSQNELLGYVDVGFAEFQAAMEELNLSDCVTTFLVSEFARTLTTNGNGSDHGWGGNVMVMGGAVNGGQIFGNYPTLALDSIIDVGGGVLIPSTSCDEYFAELAIWFGVDPSELATIFPNIGNFYDVSSTDLPIGFLTT